MAENRVTSAIVEVLTPGTPNARVSSVIAEVLTPGVAQVRVSHTVVEVLATRPALPFHAATTCYGGSRGAQWPLWNRYLGIPG